MLAEGLSGGLSLPNIERVHLATGRFAIPIRRERRDTSPLGFGEAGWKRFHSESRSTSVLSVSRSYCPGAVAASGSTGA